MAKYTIPFSRCDYGLKSLVGGKNASLGELYKINQKIGFGFANGFAVTTRLYDQFVSVISTEISKLLGDIDYEDMSSLYQGSEKIKNLIVMQNFTKDAVAEISDAIKQCETEDSNKNIQFAIRSSAIAEDTANASFAGQQDTFLNVTGIEQVLHCTKLCFASLFNPQVLSYRHSQGIDESAVKLSVGIQRMVRSDLGSSGVAFSLDPDTGYRGVVVINGVFGLGESAVSGLVTPDEFVVDKKISETGSHYAILSKKLGDKKEKTVYGEKGLTTNVDCSVEEQASYSLTTNQVLELTRIVIRLEQEYVELFKKQISVDIEWALEGDQIYIVQTRPETVHSVKQNAMRYILKEQSKSLPLISGIAVGEKISTGKVRRLRSVEEFRQFRDGDILVVSMTTPDWEPIMKRSSGIITDKGSRTCHAAIIARELKINAIVGTEHGTRVLQDDQVVTVSCSEGEVGNVYPGELPFEIELTEFDQERLKHISVKMMLNVGNPETAFRDSTLPHQGVGLTRMEFTINSYIKVHPLALLNYDKLSQEWKTKIDLVVGTADGYKDHNLSNYFVDKLTSGLGKIASSFYPHDVIVRFSDFKTNEYRNLLGGELYEPEEENPMLGWRGCSRYYSDGYREAFKLECMAIRRLREEMGLTNVIVMLPFCRTPEECEKVLDVMESCGLSRQSGLQVYLMCEIPSNVIQAKEFSRYIDGVSIGGNDLFQLALGIDRDSSIQISDHTNRTYRKLIRKAVNKYKKHGVKVGFCGQQPSESLEFCQFLIDIGIDSVSVVPDTLIKTMEGLAAPVL